MTSWEKELAELVVARGPALVGYAYLLCGDRSEAEDLVQDALVRVYSRLRPHASRRRRGTAAVTLDVDGTPDNPEAYLRRTILNLHLDSRRRRRLWTQRRHLLVDDGAVSGPASGATLRADVVTALAGLSRQQRACVVLRYFEDLTVAQIATALGTAEGTVKRYLYDASGRLRTLLSTGPVTSGDHAHTATPDGGEIR
jgi:RNA polymerase sigma-70 factor (ECF subfamily)